MVCEDVDGAFFLVVLHLVVCEEESRVSVEWERSCEGGEGRADGVEVEDWAVEEEMICGFWSSTEAAGI